MNILSHHRLSRTLEGEQAWRNQTMQPLERSILGALSHPISVARLMTDMPDLSAARLRLGLASLAASGWLMIDEPPPPDMHLPPSQAHSSTLPGYQSDQAAFPLEAHGDRSRTPAVHQSAQPLPNPLPITRQVAQQPQTVAASTPDLSQLPPPEERTEIEVVPDTVLDRRLLEAMGIFSVPPPLAPTIQKPVSKDKLDDDPRRAEVLRRLSFKNTQISQSRQASHQTAAEREHAAAQSMQSLRSDAKKHSD